MTGTRNEPMLKAAGLWEHTSAKGNRYLTGRLGGVKVLILENRDRHSDDDPSHHLFFVGAFERRQGGSADRPPLRRNGVQRSRPPPGGQDDFQPDRLPWEE
jgi:hypothetical protein